MSRFSYREPAWLILLAGIAVGLTIGFPAGCVYKTSKPQGVYLVGSPEDPNTWEGGVIPQGPKRSVKNSLWEIGVKAAEEAKRENEAAGRR